MYRLGAAAGVNPYISCESPYTLFYKHFDKGLRAQLLIFDHGFEGSQLLRSCLFRGVLLMVASVHVFTVNCIVGNG